MMRSLAGILAMSCAAAAVAADPGLSCASVTTLRIPDVRVMRTSEIVPDPVWLAPLPTDNDRIRAPVRARFCRVEGVIEDEIGFELWLPERNAWNGRMLGVGNGGFAGFFRYEGLARGVNRGFASVSTDTGHKITEINWSIGKPRRLENLGHRGQHLTAVNAKQIIAAYYGDRPHHSYFTGCSGGGMQAMNEVQRYPADYDGILAGAHGTSIVGISARWLASALIAQYKPEANLSNAQWRKVADAAIEQCDANDGVRDGIINQPQRCEFDVAATPGLSAAQIASARALLGPVTGQDGFVHLPAFDPGVAFSPITSPGRAGEVFAQWGHGDPNWDFRQFDPGRDVPLVEALVPGASFTNPNLDAFRRRGGKLISYHGWTDQIVPAQSTIDYYRLVERFMGPEATREFYRLYLPPGMDHCRGGVGPDNFGATFGEDLPKPDAEHDMLTAIVEWVENGRAPQRLIATKIEGGVVKMTRPLCPYPQVSKYRGRGDPNDAQNFTCTRRDSPCSSARRAEPGGERRGARNDSIDASMNKRLRAGIFPGHARRDNGLSPGRTEEDTTPMSSAQKRATKKEDVDTAAASAKGGMRVAAIVKNSILEGRFVPGQRLVEVDLVRETGESRAHVREGLRHLRAEGLVEIEEYRGAVVKRITRNDIYLAGRVREALEGLAARQIAERALTEEERTTLTTLRARLIAAAESENYGAYTAANEELHQFIIRASHNPYLDSVLDRLRVVVRQTQHFSAYRSKAFFAGNVEHLAIIEAILHGHPEVAESMMRMHVRKGTLMIDEWLKNHVDADD